MRTSRLDKFSTFDTVFLSSIVWPLEQVIRKVLTGVKHTSHYSSFPSLCLSSSHSVSLIQFLWMKKSIFLEEGFIIKFALVLVIFISILSLPPKIPPSNHTCDLPPKVIVHNFWRGTHPIYSKIIWKIRLQSHVARKFL